ncbi:hypothetical protein P43SY_007077 [Pythium insidiosum]|uniref:Chloride channel protein n=1 Tax=Pythium insidiosum TaxID=114742 RepID=A0AAD5MFV9_PYTIN|nr:hypothetical protein P43SY_007077 [Pythium insidiosum]
MVTVKDEEVRPLSFSDAVLKVVKPSAPFQIERTPKEFRQLETALSEWSETHGNNSPPCQFCAPFVRAESAKGLVALLTSPFKPKKTLQQWEDWLSTAIQHVSSADLATASPCAGIRHIPSLLARQSWTIERPSFGRADRGADELHAGPQSPSDVRKSSPHQGFVLPPLHLDDPSDFASSLNFRGDGVDAETLVDTRTLSRSDVSQDAASSGRERVDGGRGLWSWLRRFATGASEPGFYDLNDPVRRKQAAEVELEVSDSEDDSEWTDGEEDEDEEDTALLHTNRSLADGNQREQMTELTVSFLESTWVFLLLVGILASVTAWSVDGAVLAVTRLHESFTALGGAWLPDYLLYTTFRVFILLLGVTCTYFVCPNAAGSGIPEMRSILGGFPFPNYLRGRTLLAKALGLICALGSGLSIGKEGPFVHLSCIIAHQLLRVPLFKQIKRSQDLTHHVLSAACAVGVTATFGTPIGGVLFSIEVTTTYYVTSNYWRAFFASVVGVVVFRSLNSLLSGNHVSLFATEFDVLPYQPFEMAWFLLLAALCGLLAALFVRTYRAVVAAKSVILERVVFTHFPTGARRLAPFFYAALVALVFSLVEYPVGSFMLLSQREVIDDMFSEGNLTTATHLNEIHGTAWTSPSLALNLGAYIAVRFFSTALSATVMVPSGIVTPVFAIGAVLGRLFGEFVVSLGGGDALVAGGYAVVGAASFTAGITGTVSIAVIVFELTSQLSYMVPVLLCVLVGRSVALFFSLDLYETISREKQLPQWPDLTKQKSYGLIAGDLMRSLDASRPYWLCRHQTAASLRQLLHDTPRDVAVFPVVDDVKSMIYLGVADREELESILESWELCLQLRKTSDSAGRPTSPSRRTGRRPRDEIMPMRDSMSAFAFPSSSSSPPSSPLEDETMRDRAMASQLALAGVSPAQAAALSALSSEAERPVDLVQLGLLSLDAINFHVHRDTFASHVILLISVHKAPQLFVTARGKLLGVIHAADLLARTRRLTL